MHSSRWAFIALLGLEFILPACGGGKSQVVSLPTVSVIVSPSTANLSAGSSTQFSATVTGSSDTSVTWQVNGITGGSATVGTISASGLYVAPAAPPAGVAIQVTAVAHADATKTSSAAVSVTAATVSVAVMPATVSIEAAQSQQFAANVQNTSDTTVIWNVNGIPGGNTSVGTITSNGMYTAPRYPPPGGTANIIAVLQHDLSKSATGMASIKFGDESLAGSYAVRLFATDVGSAHRAYWLYASVQLDGKGNISSGTGTYRANVDGVNSVISSLSLTGTYTVGSDGRGQIGLVTSVPTLRNLTTLPPLRLLAVSDNDFEAMSTDPTLAATATFERQDASAFSQAGLAGSFVFRWGNRIGRFDVDASGAFSNAAEDFTGTTINPPQSFSGNLTVGPDGTGTMTFRDASNSLSFHAYVVSANHVIVLSTDATYGYAGNIERQAGGPMSSATVNGGFVFTLGGTQNNTAHTIFASAGIIKADGTGAFTSGDFDVVAWSTPPAISQSLTGIYSVETNGRGTAIINSTLGVMSFVFYVESPSLLLMIENDSSATANGRMWLQSGGPFSVKSLQSNWGLTSSMSGNGSGNTSALGQFAADGNGAFSGFADLLDSTALTIGAALPGTYTVSSSGRGTLTVTSGPVSGNASIFLVSPTDARILIPDALYPIAGTLINRF